MRIICFIFFTIVWLRIHKISANNDDDRYEAIVDAKLVEYDDDDDAEEERPIRKERVKMIKNFVGTNLFGDSGCRKKCFSTADIATLAARRDFESLIPKDLPNCLLDDELAKILMQYFYGANQVIDKMAGGQSKLFAQKAFYDTLGGYLKYYMIPISRYSFYAGLVKLRTAQNILELYTQCKIALNTNGNGWRAPITDFTDLDVQIEPLRIVISNKEEDTSCTQLDMLDEHNGEDDDMIVSLPRLDPEERGELGNIWLPFKRKRTFNLQSCMSAFVLLRYFELTTRCYNYQGICQDTFNKKFKEWILENLEIHLGDDVLYPGLGAVLRIVETLRRKNKDTVVIADKKNTKRQKTQKYNSLDNKAKPINTYSEVWVNDVFEAKDTIDSIEETNIQSVKNRRMKYIYIAIGVSVFLLILVFIGIALALYNRWHGRSTQDETKPPPTGTKTGWRFWCWKSRKDDEELLLSSKDSSHKSSSKSSKPSKKDSKKGAKSSNVSPPESKTCFGMCAKKNSPAIIETSSMDSDSGRESKKKRKAHSSSPAKPKTTKASTVDEKKRFSISKKNKPKKPEENQQAVKKGILKKETW